MFVNRGTGGLADYWHDVSYGNIDFSNSVVLGWYTESATTATEVAEGRWARYNDCLSAASYSPPAGTRVVVITSPGVDEWGADGAAFLGEAIDVTGAAHEVGHSMGMIHSFSDDPNFRDAPWSQIGEYDDEWDLMSAANVYTTATTRFGSAPPGLNGFGLDRAGWIPRNRVYNFGAAGEQSANLTITALEHPAGGGYLYLRVPFDPGDLMHYYTVELRSADGWDAGIPNGGGVMIHEVKLNTNDGLYQSYLIRSHTGNRDPLTSLSASAVTISVNWVNRATHQASIHITGAIATRCLQGYVWRQARPQDHVCVTPATRAQAWADNAAAPSRVNPTGPYGPHTCIQGYVWREAFLNDFVCVTGAVRAQTKADNLAAPRRINPSRLVFGPSTCAPGYVWREADNSDYVCVTPATRAQAWADNAAAPSRVNPTGPYGPHTCIQGYVWREAFLNDFVCVTGTVRAQAKADNLAASSRIAHA
jgi:hypothetical protein